MFHEVTSVVSVNRNGTNALDSISIKESRSNDALFLEFSRPLLLAIRSVSNSLHIVPAFQRSQLDRVP